MLRVVNIYTMPKDGSPAARVYIGRPGKGQPGSILANPFRLKLKAGQPGAEEEREKCLRDYMVWLRREWGGNKKVRAEIERIADLSEAGDVELVCFCHPRPCHGDVILKAVEGVLRHRSPGSETRKIKD